LNNTPNHPPSRVPAIDVAKGVALVAMAIYHFVWDLEFFGWVAPFTIQQSGWVIFARSIAASFLFLVGINMVLTYTRGIVWPAFLKRLAVVGDWLWHLDGQPGIVGNCGGLAAAPMTLFGKTPFGFKQARR
jgi:uncharacterized membrane protein